MTTISERLTASHWKILHAIANSTEVAYPNVSGPGEVTYKQIADLTGIAENKLPEKISAKSINGKVYSNSLENLGLVQSTKYEKTSNSGVYGKTNILFSLTHKGEELIFPPKKVSSQDFDYENFDYEQYEQDEHGDAKFSDSAHDDDDEISEDGWQPFPLECFPAKLKDIIERRAESMQVDPCFLSTPMLAVLGAAIGNSRLYQVPDKKDSWFVRACVWAVNSAGSGSRKTPALAFVKAPMMRHEKKLIEAYETAIAVWKGEVDEWERSKEKHKGPKPEKPSPRPHAVIQDCTTECINVLHQSSPRGLFACFNELGQWFAAADRYTSGGKSGGDTAIWCNYFDGETIIVNRKTGEPADKNVFVENAFVSLCGVIPPSILSRYITHSEKESGLAARMLIVMPPKKIAQWTVDGPEDDSKEWGRIVDAILRLEPEQDEKKNPVFITASKEARDVWVAFFEQHQKDSDSSVIPPSLGYAFSKLENYCNKIALILHIAEWACSMPDSDDYQGRSRFKGTKPTDEISGETMRKAVILTEWFKNEIKRVYDFLEPVANNDDSSEENFIVAYRFVRKKLSICARDLHNNFKTRWTLPEAGDELERLVTMDLLERCAAKTRERSTRYKVKKPATP